MIWWCDYDTSLGLRLLWNAGFLATPGWIHKSAALIHWEKGHDTAYKMAVTLGIKQQDHWLQVSNRLHLSCCVNLSYQIYGRRACLCGDSHMNVRDDILRLTKDRGFQFKHLASGVFNIGDVAWSIILEICALSERQKGSNAIIQYVCSHSSIFLSHSYLKYNLYGEIDMPMCLVAHTHSRKMWTTLWMVTTCIASTERVFASLSAWQCETLISVFQVTPNSNFDVKMVYDLTTGQSL